ncbi:hypothetical protein [Enterovibrio norvegicus]|uniref:Uncharacterized protein n=1 Tax=Enterovibrio norvegicus TaxID=188144 RepID=A0ABV4L568_9GAMM
MERLDQILALSGASDRTPSHVTHSFVMSIMHFAACNGDRELEANCEAKLNEIQETNAE